MLKTCLRWDSKTPSSNHSNRRLRQETRAGHAPADTPETPVNSAPTADNPRLRRHQHGHALAAMPETRASSAPSAESPRLPPSGIAHADKKATRENFAPDAESQSPKAESWK